MPVKRSLISRKDLRIAKITRPSRVPHCQAEFEAYMGCLGNTTPPPGNVMRALVLCMQKYSMGAPNQSGLMYHLIKYMKPEKYKYNKR